MEKDTPSFLIKNIDNFNINNLEIPFSGHGGKVVTRIIINLDAFIFLIFE